MATQAHCAYCFETLAASFEKRQPLSLKRVEELWNEYTQHNGRDDEDDAEDVEMAQAKPAAVSRLLNLSPASNNSKSSSSTSLSTTGSGSSNTDSAASTSKSSTSSLSSTISRALKSTPEASHPLFITWNTMSRSGKSLRGCIGTFEAQPLSGGLRSYALTSAFEDYRFDPIPASELSRLQVCVTLLTNFSAPDSDPLNWVIGEHGIRLSFLEGGRKYSSTYLPDVALEQGWTKEEAITSLMRKSGWAGRKSDWRSVKELRIVRYEGKKVDLDYPEWKSWRDWVDARKR